MCVCKSSLSQSMMTKDIITRPCALSVAIANNTAHTAILDITPEPRCGLFALPCKWYVYSHSMSSPAGD